MDHNSEHQSDTLNDRGWFDRAGFIVFSFVGAALILLAKSFGLSAVAVAIGAMLAMLLYALLVHKAGTGRLRSDQAGDNCYYLGLIYTLISLAHAIFNFDPATTATSIVQGFGVALSSTITGLILRVFFNQMRVDLVETEDTARVDLADAAGQLKAVLHTITVDMTDFGRGTKQILQEMQNEMLSSLQSIHEQSEGVVLDTAGKAAVSFNDLTKSSSSFMNEVRNQAQLTLNLQEKKLDETAEAFKSSSADVLTALRRQVTSLGNMTNKTDGMATGLESIRSIIEKSQDEMARLTERANELSSMQQALNSAADNIGKAVNKVADTLSNFESSAARFEENASKRIDTLNEAPIGLVKSTSEAFEQATAAMRTQVDLISSQQKDFSDQTKLQLSETIEALRKHNTSLETELAKSGENVLKVHSSLVDMTSSLIKNVEAINQ